MYNTKLITEWVASLEINRYDFIEIESELKINRSVSKFKNYKANLSEALDLLQSHREDNIRERVLGDLEIHGVNKKKQYYVITLHPVVKRISNAVNQALQSSTKQYPIRVSKNLK